MLKEPVCGILKVAIMLQRVRVADEKASITARVELRPWVCCVSARMGSRFSSGRLGSTSSVGSVGKSKKSQYRLFVD